MPKIIKLIFFPVLEREDVLVNRKKTSSGAITLQAKRRAAREEIRQT